VLSLSGNIHLLHLKSRVRFFSWDRDCTHTHATPIQSPKIVTSTSEALPGHRLWG